jgi:hypothetical protein
MNMGGKIMALALLYNPIAKEIIKEGEGPKPVIRPLQMATLAY